MLIVTSSPSTAQVQGASPTTLTAPIQASDPNQVQIEALTSAVATLSTIVQNIIQTPQVAVSMLEIEGADPSEASTVGNSACYFCGGIGHFMEECNVVTEFTRAGKCKWSPNGKVVLPSGAMVSRRFTGAWLCDRIEEWHRQNPGQKATEMYLAVQAAPMPTAPLQTAVQPTRRYPAQQAEQRQSAKLERAYGSRQSPPIYSEEITGNSSSNMAFQAQYRDILPPITQKASTIKSGQSAEVSEDAEASRMVGGIQDKDRTAIRRCPEAAATNIPAAFGAATSTVQVHYNQQPASPNLSLRDKFSPRTLALASPLPSEPVPHWIETFPLAQAYIQVEPVPQTSSSSCQADAFLVHPPRHNLSPPIPAQTSILPSPVVPAPIPQFPPALQSYS